MTRHPRSQTVEHPVTIRNADLDRSPAEGTNTGLARLVIGEPDVGYEELEAEGGVGMPGRSADRQHLAGEGRDAGEHGLKQLCRVRVDRGCCCDHEELRQIGADHIHAANGLLAADHEIESLGTRRSAR